MLRSTLTKEYNRRLSRRHQKKLNRTVDDIPMPKRDDEAVCVTGFCCDLLIKGHDIYMDTCRCISGGTVMDFLWAAG